MYVKQTELLAVGVECTHFRCMPLSALRHGWHYLMQQVGLRSCCTQCGLPHCSLLHLLLLWPPLECEIPAPVSCPSHLLI